MNIRTLALTGITAAVLAACGGGSSGDSSTPTTPQTPATSAATLSGAVYAAEVSGSTVSVYLADAQGKPTGSALGTATTDSSGNYSIQLSSVPTGPVVLVASGGTYTSEADGSKQTLGTFSSLLPSISGGSNTAQINPVTTTIAAATSNLLVQGSGSLATALDSATTSVKQLFGLTQLTGNPTTTASSSNATSGDSWLLAALAGTLEQLRANASLNPVDLYKALEDDVADGKLDGLKNGQSIVLGSSTLQSSLFTTQWSGAANAYGTAHSNYAAATATISGALQTSAQAAGVATGSSGSIATLQTQSGGTQVFFAARGDGLVKLDMSDPTNPVASKVAAINSAVMKTGTGTFTSLDGIVINPTPINTTQGAKVFAILYSYQSKTIYSVNLTDGVVADSATLGISTSASFSGAYASIAGGIADGKRSKIWLASGDGLIGVDPSNLKASPIKIAQPASSIVNENLGGDPAKDIIYSPDYQNRGLVIFNLAEGKAYTMDAATWATTTGNWASYYEVDGVALDSQYNVAVMTPESGGDVGLLTYSTPSGATGAVGTIGSGAKFKSYKTNGSTAGAALDPITHTVLFVGEGTGLGVGVLDNPTSSTWQGFSKYVGAGYNSTYAFEPHDPHTVGVFNVLGKPYGFLLQGYYSAYKVAVLDLNAWLAAPTTAGLLTSDPIKNVSITKLLSY
jgi:hypothetical protein